MQKIKICGIISTMQDNLCREIKLEENMPKVKSG